MKIYHVTDSGYKFDRRLFWGGIFILIIIIGSVGLKYGFYTHTFYFNCKEAYCENPVYNEDYDAYNSYTNEDLKKYCIDDWCKYEFLPRGEYGNKPPKIIGYFDMLALGIIALILFLNHLIHNKGKRFSVELNLSKKAIAKIKDVFKGAGE